MSVETVRDAYRAGWKAKARCLGRLHDKPKDTRDCLYTADLDMVTLVMSKGPSFPLSMLGSRLMCPRCGGRAIAILYSPPADAAQERASRR